MKLKKLPYLIGLFLVLFFFCLPVMANETITSMADLAPLRETTVEEDRSEATTYQNPRILIYYSNPGENNIGLLGLNKEDFNAGKTLNPEIDLLELSYNTSSDQLIDEISQKPEVKAVDYDITSKACALPNDKFAHIQYNFTALGLDKIWQKNNENSVKVAVLDTGLNTASPDLAGRYAQGYDFIHQKVNMSDDNGHGTEVSHILAACTNNEIGIAGASGTYNVLIVPYKVLDAEGNGKLSTIATAMIHAANDPEIKVINLSLGFDGENSVLETLVQTCYDKGKIVVASSGNDGGSVLYPARYPQVIAVGSIDQQERLCTSQQWGIGNGSNHGQGLDFVAPGDNIPTGDGEDYVFNSGTSFSAPEVSGVIAVLLTQDPTLTQERIKYILSTTAKDLGSTGYDTDFGYGLVKADKALQLIKELAGQGQQPEEPIPEYKPVNLSITTHCENVGWQSPVSNLAVAGTVGKNQKLEAFKIGDDSTGISITSQVHVENVGTMDPVSENNTAGTTGHNFGIEAVLFELNGTDASQYKLYYRTHVENFGWTAWTSNGNWSGTSGLNLQLEAIQMTVVKATDPAPNMASNVEWTYR